MKHKIAIIGGSGAVAAYFALSLTRSQNNVAIFGRKNSENLLQIQNHGLTVITYEGENKIQKETIIPNNQFTYVGSYDEYTGDKFDLVIVSLKGPNMTSEIAKQILEITHDNSVVGIISNGLPFYFLNGLKLPGKDYINAIDPDGIISKSLKARCVIGILPVIAAHVESPGKVQITRRFDQITVALGSPYPASNNKIQPILNLLNNAGIKTSLTDRLHKNILEKLQFALSVNILSAILEQTIGEVFEAPNTQSVLRYSVELLNMMAIRLNVGTLRIFQEFKAISITKSHFSSLHNDIKSQKPAEINHIVDATIELAEYINETHTLPDLKPLHTLKSLLTQKVQGEEIKQEDLGKLFFECEAALHNLPNISPFLLRNDPYCDLPKRARL